MYGTTRFMIAQPIDHDVLLYNTLTTSLVLLDHSIFGEVFREKRFGEHPHIVGKLLDMGFLLQAGGFDELAYLKRLRKTAIHASNDVDSIIIAPTTRCNARCFYCYERGIEQRTMTPAVRDSLVAFLNRACKSRTMHISWFGGEPLLATDVMDHVSSGLRKCGIKLSAVVTTNGLLVNNDLLAKARSCWGVYRFQITVDALGDEYNRIKNYVNVGDSNPFEIVQDNITRILDAGFGLNLRINYNPVCRFPRSLAAAFPHCVAGAGR